MYNTTGFLATGFFIMLMEVMFCKEASGLSIQEVGAENHRRNKLTIPLHEELKSGWTCLHNIMQV